MTAPPCAGCMGSRDCWICSGTGALDTPLGVEVCSSCLGTRECAYCLSARVVELPARTVVRVQAR